MLGPRIIAVHRVRKFFGTSKLMKSSQTSHLELTAYISGGDKSPCNCMQCYLLCIQPSLVSDGKNLDQFFKPNIRSKSHIHRSYFHKLYAFTHLFIMMYRTLLQIYTCKKGENKTNLDTDSKVFILHICDWA